MIAWRCFELSERNDPTSKFNISVPIYYKVTEQFYENDCMVLLYHVSIFYKEIYSKINEIQEKKQI